jgi:hypothetical protein
MVTAKFEQRCGHCIANKLGGRHEVGGTPRKSERERR